MVNAFITWSESSRKEMTDYVFSLSQAKTQVEGFLHSMLLTIIQQMKQFTRRRMVEEEMEKKGNREKHAKNNKKYS